MQGACMLPATSMASTSSSPILQYLLLVLAALFLLLLQPFCLLKAIISRLADVFIQRKLPRVVRTPETRFIGLESAGYSFTPNYVELQAGAGKTLPRLHYIDEGGSGSGETLLCLHGEPSWSFLYRLMIPAFVSAGYRVVAPDFIGFGKSDKYSHPESYTHDLHTQTLRLLLDHLGLKEVTLVCQDWGGLIGLTVVKDAPHLFSRLVIMNTGLPVGFAEVQELYGMPRGIPFLVWRSIAFLCGTYLPIRQVFQVALKNPSSAVLDWYSAPFPSSEYKGATAQWPLLVPITSNTPVAMELQETRDFLASSWKKPALVMFGEDDLIMRGNVSTFVRLLPHAFTITVDGAGHFIQEDKGEEIATHIISFIDNRLPPPAVSVDIDLT